MSDMTVYRTALLDMSRKMINAVCPAHVHGEKKVRLFILPLWEGIISAAHKNGEDVEPYNTILLEEILEEIKHDGWHR
jgi:hypothetical protein